MKQYSFGASLKDQMTDDYAPKSSVDFLFVLGMGISVLALIAIIGRFITPVRIMENRFTAEQFYVGMNRFSLLLVFTVAVVLSLLRRKYLNGFAFGRVIQREESNELIKELGKIIKEKHSAGLNTTYLEIMQNKLREDVIKVKELKKLRKLIQYNLKKL